MSHHALGFWAFLATLKYVHVNHSLLQPKGKYRKDMLHKGYDFQAALRNKSMTFVSWFFSSSSLHPRFPCLLPPAPTHTTHSLSSCSPFPLDYLFSECWFLPIDRCLRARSLKGYVAGRLPDTTLIGLLMFFLLNAFAVDRWYPKDRCHRDKCHQDRCLVV